MDNNKHFINRLESDIDTKILLLSHNSLWPSLQRFENRYENLTIDIFGSSTIYMKKRKNDISNDYDFIIFYSANYFNDNELLTLKDLAFKISEEQKKRVSIGYLYLIPMEKRTNKDSGEEIKIISYNNCIEHEETTNNLGNSTLLDLTEMVVVTHEELNNQKIYRYPN